MAGAIARQLTPEEEELNHKRDEPAAIRSNPSAKGAPSSQPKMDQKGLEARINFPKCAPMASTQNQPL